jgi:hypothetical protein
MHESLPEQRRTGGANGQLSEKIGELVRKCREISIPSQGGLPGGNLPTLPKRLSLLKPSELGTFRALGASEF